MEGMQPLGSAVSKAGQPVLEAGVGGAFLLGAWVKNKVGGWVGGW